MDFSWLANGIRPVQLPDPMIGAARAMSLADLAQTNQMNAMKLDEARRQQAAMAELNQALPGVMQGGWSDAALTQAVQANPQAAGALLDMAGKRRKALADEMKSQAEATEKLTNAKAKAFNDVANTAFAEARSPNNLSLSHVRSVAQFYGMQLPQFAGDERNPTDVASYLQSLGNSAYSAKDQIVNAETARANLEDEAIKRAGQDVTMRGQDLAAQTARRGQDISAGTARRGQDLEMERFATTQKQGAEGGKWVNDLARGIQVNMATGETRPITSGGQPIGAKRDAADEARDKGTLDMADRVIGLVDKISPEIGYSTAGLGGSMIGQVPGTSAYDLRAQLDTVKANLGFEQLQALRMSSPTGGALGQVSDMENRALQAAVAALDASQSPAQLKANLDRVKVHLQNVKDLIARGNEAKRTSVGATGGWGKATVVGQ